MPRSSVEADHEIVALVDVTAEAASPVGADGGRSGVADVLTGSSALSVETLPPVSTARTR